ncbi:helix-turn-helix domain-containing protein [Nocardioides cremeus]|uniref:helix-turn-helix domain-containing protein n=1 Tax=Nocardioides cremeus TaxID=3058044 RepID=UPI0034E03673
MSVREVAERQRVSPTYVTRLCRTGVLSATRAGRVWLIDARSVADFEAKRRPVA